MIAVRFLKEAGGKPLSQGTRITCGGHGGKVISLTMDGLAELPKQGVQHR